MSAPLPPAPPAEYTPSDEQLINTEDDYALTDYPEDDDDGGHESEYICDSEYVDNEYGEDDEEEDEDGGFHCEFPPDQPSYQELLGAELHNYLPTFNADIDTTSQEHMAAATELMELNGNFAAAHNAVAAAAMASAAGAAAAAGEDPEKDVVYYGFTKPSSSSNQQRRRRRNRHSMISNDNRYSGDFGLDYDAGNVITDDMSISVGGYTSTNASMSDISGVCDIEDSEANLSDDDYDAAAATMHTVV